MRSAAAGVVRAGALDLVGEPLALVPVGDVHVLDRQRAAVDLCAGAR